MICDLHCHTTLSDGSLGIEDIIVQAKRMNIDFYLLPIMIHCHLFPEQIY